MRRTSPGAAGAGQRRKRAAGARAEVGATNESFAAIYFAADRDVAADDSDIAGGPGDVQAIAGVGVAAGGLSDDPDIDVLSGCEPGSDGVGGDGAIGAAIRAVA